MLQHRQREPMHTQSSARKYIQDALDHCGNTHSVDDVLQMVEDGKAQLHVGNRCAVVTQEMDFPAGRQLHYWLAGGDLEELQEIAMDHMRVSNRIHSLKVYLQRLKDNKKFGNDILEFDDPVLEDIAHG